MKRLVLTGMVFAAVGLGSAQAETRAVVEMFTSQGCSSCPPADRLARELARDPSIVVLSLPVDYWDYLGWKDTLANPAFTKRQKAYAAARGDRNIYTPQAVVNGVVHVVGSDMKALDIAVRESRQNAAILETPVTITARDGGYDIAIAAGPNQGEVWLIPTESKADVAIGRGENSGHSVTYANVARAMTKIGDYAGAALTVSVPKADVAVPGADGFAVLVQTVSDGNPGAILGAAAFSQ